MLRGEVRLLLREARAKAARAKGGRARGGRGEAKPPPRPLDAAALERFVALKAWRAEVARAHNLPAYVVFHDATLAEMADLRPDSLAALGEISGVGAREARGLRRADPARAASGLRHRSRDCFTPRPPLGRIKVG